MSWIRRVYVRLPRARTGTRLTRCNGRATAERDRSDGVENFIVVPRRQLVGAVSQNLKRGKKLTQDRLLDLSKQVRRFAAQLDPEDEEAKRFDVLMLTLQLAVLRSERSFSKLQKSAKPSRPLEEKSSIPMVQAQMN